MLKRIQFYSSITALAALGWGIAPAHAEDVTITRGEKDASIQQLRIKTHPDITQESVGNELREYVIIEGIYPRPDWSLIIGKVKLKRNEKGYFKAKTRITAKEKVLSFAAVGPGGQVETENLKISYPEYSPNRKKVSRHSFSVGGGLTLINYKQEGSALSDPVQLSEKAFTLKGSYVYRLAPPNWDLGITVFGTGFVMSSDIPNTTAKFLGANFRIGYAVPQVSEPWRLLLMFGGYYTTMSVTPNTFGFKNLSGPQFFPVIRRALAGGNSIATYLKFSPVASGGFGISSLSSRELAIGASYNMNLKNGHSVPFSIDYANLKSDIEPEGGGTAVPVSNTSITFGAGYNF